MEGQSAARLVAGHTGTVASLSLQTLVFTQVAGLWEGGKERDGRGGGVRGWEREGGGGGERGGRRRRERGGGEEEREREGGGRGEREGGREGEREGREYTTWTVF